LISIEIHQLIDCTKQMIRVFQKYIVFIICFYLLNLLLQTNHRSPSRSCQITMVYRGVGSERHGDEIMVLRENLIVFKGFLRPQGFIEIPNFI
jgi:hypothetical protein